MFRQRTQPFIYNGGRRCGNAKNGNDTSSAMCNGSRYDGSLFVSDEEIVSRCAADARCVGYAQASKNHVRYYRPISAWAEGARFPALRAWRVHEKACAPSTSPMDVRELAASFPSPPWPALIISGNATRFASVKAKVKALGFDAEQMPAIFPPSQNDSLERHQAWTRHGSCQTTGYNGVRAAHRQAWQRIVQTKTAMAVFEEDAVPMPGLAVSVKDVAAFLAIASKGGYDMAFLNEVCPDLNRPYLSNAAQWISPKAASAFLYATRQCFPSLGEMRDIDHHTGQACFQYDIRCLEAPAVNGRQGGFGCGLFAQDRKNIEPWRGFEYGRR